MVPQTHRYLRKIIGTNLEHHWRRVHEQFKFEMCSTYRFPTHSIVPYRRISVISKFKSDLSPLSLKNYPSIGWHFEQHLSTCFVLFQQWEPTDQ